MTSRIGNYELLDHFATGGVAEIYRARDVRSGEIVVVKRIRPDLDFDPEQHAGFIRELQLALKCAHKNLIRGFDKGTTNGFDYGVLEFVDGQDLQRVLQRLKLRGNARLPFAFATFIVAEVLDGLDFAWKQLGLVHRDVAPKNILVRYDGQVRVGDFGAALDVRSERADTVVGTPGYMSPEQASLASLDQRSDLFAAGVLLFELLAGHPAFDLEGKKDAAILKLHQKAQLRALPRDVPEDLRLVVEIATSLDPDDRYPTARDFRHGLATTDFRPDAQAMGGLADLVRGLFEDEYRKSRM